MRSLVGGGLGCVQRRNLSVAHQMSIVVLVACLTGVEVVPQGGWDASPELSDG